MNYKELNYKSWNKFKSEISYDICGKSSFPQERFIFRGQTNENWKLMASFDRLYGHLLFDERKEIEDGLLSEFRRMCVDWEGVAKVQTYSEQQLRSVGQHYGLPTRLLDWTYSIYVASFFAFSQAMNGSSNVAIWVINKEHDIWKGGYGVTIETIHTEENERQKYQSGIFTLNQSVANTLDDYVDTCALSQRVDGALYKILLPASEWENALKDMDMMGINSFNLYRGIEGCAKAAVLKELLRRTP